MWWFLFIFQVEVERFLRFEIHVLYNRDITLSSATHTMIKTMKTDHVVTDFRIPIK